MKKCSICQKKAIWVTKYKKLRSKYNPTRVERKYPNLQWVKFPLDVRDDFKKFAGKKLLVCTKCIKSAIKRK